MRAKSFLAFLLLVFSTFVCRPAAAEGEGVDVVLHLSSQSAITFTSAQSSFNLTLADFSNGSISDTAQIAYSITANDVGRIQDNVMVRMDVLMDGIALEARMDSFSARGNEAHLVSKGSGFVTLNTFDQGVADKVTDQGDGKIVDGDMILSYRARAAADLAAGQHEATVMVTFVDN